MIVAISETRFVDLSNVFMISAPDEDNYYTIRSKQGTEIRQESTKRFPYQRIMKKWCEAKGIGVDITKDFAYWDPEKDELTPDQVKLFREKGQWMEYGGGFIAILPLYLVAKDGADLVEYHELGENIRGWVDKELGDKYVLPMRKPLG